MNITRIGRIAATALATTTAIGFTALALTFGAGAQIGGIVADDPPVTTTPPPPPDGNGWGHG